MTVATTESNRLPARASELVTRRHRYGRTLAVGVFLVTLLIGAYVIKSHPQRYVSSGTVVIVGSESLSQRSARSDERVNPFTQSVLARFRDPTVVGDIVARTYQSWGKQATLRRRGLRGELLVTTKTTVASPTPDHGPVVVFTVVGSEPNETQAGVAMVIADLRQELAQWQRGADPGLSVSDAIITSPDRGLLATGSRPRSVVAVVAMAALLAWLVGQIFRRN